MKSKSILFRETLLRVGKEEMRGIQRLLDDGHTGIAERHTVEKLLTYVRGLESALGRSVGKADDASLNSDLLKINGFGGTNYALRA